ncbi:MAG: hypothetical protein MJ072_00060 [Clostridia bacterium]|nr:hypothetical protein [Clostridia bacterium]
MKCYYKGKAVRSTKHNYKYAVVTFDTATGDKIYSFHETKENAIKSLKKYSHFLFVNAEGWREDYRETLDPVSESMYNKSVERLSSIKIVEIETK